ncbi:MAG: hypothetical protein HPY53_08260 [Brevinematales bacterium]|nr:hypothetical protein [Brevinematales bacterium]
MLRMRVVLIALLLTAANGLYGKYDKDEEGVRKNPKDIVDYFLILPGEYLDPYFADMGFEERLYFLENNDSLELTVDMKNAYISVKGPYNDTAIEMVVTYFVRADKTKVIAVSRTEPDSHWEFVRVCGFYELKDGNFTDITKHIFPKITLDLFVADAYKKLVTSGIYTQFVVETELPQFGTVAKVYPKGIPTYLFESEDEQYTYEDIMATMPYLWLELAWNKQKGKFEFGKKVKK